MTKCAKCDNEALYIVMDVPLCAGDAAPYVQPIPHTRSYQPRGKMYERCGMKGCSFKTKDVSELVRVSAVIRYADHSQSAVGFRKVCWSHYRQFYAERVEPSNHNKGGTAKYRKSSMKIVDDGRDNITA